MTFNINIETNYGLHWINTSRGYVSATAFLGNRFLDDTAWKEILAGLNTPEDAAELISQLNGSFAMALTFEDVVFLCVDRQRTIPLFYELTSDVVTIYNHISLEKIKQNGVDVSLVDHLEHCLFIPGEKTAAKGVFQVMAGQYLMIDRLGSASHKAYVSDVQVQDYPDTEKLMTLIDQKFEETIKRLITVLDGRRAVIPLSGGHDSRLIVYYLKHLGYDNILTYTYGPKGNFESETSRKVAEYLGLDWHFVEYKPKELQKLFRQEFRNVVDFCSNGVSSIGIQEWFALHQLKNQGIITSDDIIVPGFSFDFIAGSFILPRYIESSLIKKEQIFSDICWKNYREGKLKLSNAEQENFRQMVDTSLLGNVPEAVDAQEAFKLYRRYIINERKAKFICNHVRLHEYHGFSWYLPLWDTELVDFWETIPLRMKYNRQIFRDFTVYKYAPLMQAAPIQNEKLLGKKPPCMNPIWRMIRKLWQLLNYVGFHYCLAYFDRWTVYKVFLTTKILGIGYMVNREVKKLFLEE